MIADIILGVFFCEEKYLTVNDSYMTTNVLPKQPFRVTYINQINSR